MPGFTIEVPADKVTPLVDAFCATYNYKDEVPDPANPGDVIPNPVGRAEFAKTCVKNYIKEVYTAAKLKEVEATRQTLIGEAQTETTDFDVL